jgi:hypothetical protein
VKRKSPSDERSAGNRHATFCGSRGRFVAPGDPVRGQQCPRLLGDLKENSSSAVSWNIKSSGKRSRLRRTCSLKRLVLTP